MKQRSNTARRARLHELTILVLAMSLPACSSPAGEEHIGRSSAPIIGGTPDAGDPAVVLLISYPPDESAFYTCTASVIAPTVLLTAAHCVDQPNHPGFSFGAFLGSDASTFSAVADLAPELVPASDAIAHPQYDAYAPDYPADIAVVVLASPVAVPPLPFNEDPLDASIVGLTARLVGYGQTHYGQYNATKYTTTTSVFDLDLDGHTVVVGDYEHHTCVGDSGGPALVTIGGQETIVGTDSFTPSEGCIEPAHFQRVDVYRDFVTSYLPARGAGGSAASSGSVASSSSSSTSVGSGGGASSGTGWADDADSDGDESDSPSAHGCTASSSSPSGSALSLLGLVIASALARSKRRRG